MRTTYRGRAIVPLTLLATGLLACAHVPPEAVQLSYQIGQDLPRLHASFDALIHERFEDFRARRNAYVDEVWTPRFLGSWVEKGKLVEVAKGNVVWSFEQAAFVTPSAGLEKQELLATVNEWSRQALVQIQRKRAELLDPLDSDEKQLRAQVREAFLRVVQANAYVTAHLASLRNVETAQDEALAALSLKDLRDQIDQALVKASDAAAVGLQKVKEADGTVEAVADKAKRMKL